jgi:hypothetical protein
MKKALLIIVAIIPFFQSCDFFQKKDLFSNDRDSLLLYQKKQDSLKFVDSIQALKNELSQLRSENRRLLDSIKSAGDRRQFSGNKYHIIVGSFRNSEYLNSYNKYIQEKGFTTNILENKYGFRMVSVESFNNWRKAVNTLEELRKDLESQTWIYVAD